MKTAKLQKHGKGWQLAGDKMISVPDDFGLTEDMNGQEVEFDNTGGPVRLIRYNGKDYTKQQTTQLDMAKRRGNYGYQGSDRRGGYPQQQERSGGAKDGGSRKYPARAPYNFVPLNEIVVPAEDRVDFDAFAKGRLSGYIYLKIETLTPIFIRGNRENFLNPSGQLILQGSSIRGLVRNLVEICSYAKFKAEYHYEDRRMYYRAMADMANRLREKYKDEIANGVEAGYLSYDNRSRTYYIQPAEGFDRIQAKGRFKYLQSEDGIEVHSGSMQGKYHNWVVFPPNVQESPIPLDPKLIKSYEGDDNRANQVFDVLKLARKGKNGSVEFPNGVPVFFKRKGEEVTSFGHTRNYRLPYSATISEHVPEALREEGFLDLSESIFGRSGEGSSQILSGKVFFEDSTPRKVLEVKTRLAALKILGTPKPTTFQHYLVQPNGIYTPNAKLQHWGDKLWADKGAKIRGFKQYWHRTDPEGQKSALWAEKNLVLKNDDIQKWIDRNPNSKANWEKSKFLLRVEKDGNGIDKVRIEGDVNELPEGLKSVLVKYYNLDSAITKQIGIAKPQNSIVNLVLEQEQFDARVRFENLTEVELGALLFVLDLPEGCAHKLGMGKPLGLGSVKIKPTLSVIKREDRYDEVFDEQGNWKTSEESINSLLEYKDYFARFMGRQLGKEGLVKDADSYWLQDERMKDLRYMLSLEYAEKTDLQWLDRTRYMDLKEFKSRPILPTPSEVIKLNTYQND